jgi:hypothetical protein
MTRRRRLPEPEMRPRCVFCGRGDGVRFVMFAPRFKPFGTACFECERTLPPGTTVPQLEEITPNA